MRTRASFLILALAGAALDLASKAWSEAAYLANGGKDIRVIDGFFSIAWTTNRGIVFGRFAEFPWAGPVFLVISILAVPAIAAIYFSVKKPRGILTASLGLILAGTLGNMVDRLAFGHVRDFLKFFYVDAAGEPHIWPLFNLADSFICVGVALLSIDILFFDTPKKRAARAAAATAGVTTVVEVAGADPTEPMPRVDLPEPHHAQEANSPVPPAAPDAGQAAS